MIEAWFRIFAAKKKRRWYCFLLCEDFSKTPRRPNVLGRLGVFTACFGIFTACFGIFTACFGIFTACFGIFTACFGIFTACFGIFTACFGIFTACFGIFTACFGIFTACFGIFTACFGIFTACFGIFTACLGIFTGHIRKATCASLMRQSCGVFSAAHGGDVFKTSRSTRSLVVTFGWLRFQCPCRAVKNGFLSLCASPANKV